MSKYFLVSNEVNSVSKEAIAEIEERSARNKQEHWEKTLADFQLELAKRKDAVTPANDRVLIIADLHSKSTYRFANGMEISLVRNVDNMNRRQTQPVNGIVLNAKNIPTGSEIIMHHNALDGNNELVNYKRLGEESQNVKYLSVPEHDCYLYRLPNSEKWLPCEGFATALRCYTPYSGIIEGIKPTRLKNRLLITSGKYKGQVCLVANGADYQMVFQGLNGREQNVIRLRTFEYENFERDEIIGVDHENTRLYNAGKLLAGITPDDAKKRVSACNEETELVWVELINRNQ